MCLPTTAPASRLALNAIPSVTAVLPAKAALLSTNTLKERHRQRLTVTVDAPTAVHLARSVVVVLINKKVCSPRCHRGRKCGNIAAAYTTSEIIVIDTDGDDSPAGDDLSRMKDMLLPHLQLQREDERRLLGGQWLHNNRIFTAERLLKGANIDGLYTPLIGTSPTGFEAVKVGAIQIHNSERFYWVASTAGLLGGTVEVFDSLATGRLVKPLRRQLADLLANGDGEKEVTMKPAQQQRLGERNLWQCICNCFCHLSCSWSGSIHYHLL